jgi:dipeptidyl aminopeptidase/acylaminoacyl peptidase
MTTTAPAPRPITPLLLALLAAGCGFQDNPVVEERVARDVPAHTIDEFLTTTAMGGASFSPDGSKVLVSSNQSGIFNAYAIPTTGGSPAQLTDSDSESIFVQGYFPADERFLYLADRGGNELDHLYVQSPDGAVRDLTPGENLKAVFAGWAQDERAFHVATNERDPRFFDLYAYDVDTYEREMLYRNEEGLDAAAISPDGRWLALSKSNTTNDSDVYLLDRQSGVRAHLTPHEGDQSNVPQTFSPDGRYLYFTSDEGSEFARLVRHELATGARTVVYEPGWDVWWAEFSRDGRWFITGANVDARTRIEVRDVATMRPVELPDLPGDVTSLAFDRAGDRIAFYASGSRFPSDLFVHPLGTGEVTRLTSNLNPAIDPDDLVDGEVARFASYDGLQIPGILYLPHQASAENPVPGLVWVHGGPGGQSRIGYSSVIQYLVNHGYAVYAINNRGSSGYGKTFFKADDKRHGDADLDDVVASKGLLVATGLVDSTRIGVIGGSYGGYMTLAALTFRPEAFEAGVDLFGISNWVRTIESIPPWWESFREALYTEIGHPVEDRDALFAKSPLFHADSIRRPLMVLQGANDPRVLQVESDDIVDAVRDRGVPVEYLVFDDEGHGFEKKENQLRGYEAILRFLDTHLKGIEATESVAN